MSSSSDYSTGDYKICSRGKEKSSSDSYPPTPKDSGEDSPPTIKSPEVVWERTRGGKIRGAGKVTARPTKIEKRVTKPRKPISKVSKKSTTTIGEKMKDILVVNEPSATRALVLDSLGLLEKTVLSTVSVEKEVAEPRRATKRQADRLSEKLAALAKSAPKSQITLEAEKKRKKEIAAGKKKIIESPKKKSKIAPATERLVIGAPEHVPRPRVFREAAPLPTKPAEDVSPPKAKAAKPTTARVPGTPKSTAKDAEFVPQAEDIISSDEDDWQHTPSKRGSRVYSYSPLSIIHYFKHCKLSLDYQIL